MKLTTDEFKARLAAQSLTLSLIGMSGMGKSYRSTQLARLGFAHDCCDDLIAAELGELLPTNDVSGLAEWMGQPFTVDYRVREQEYLALEERITRDALESQPGNRVIDTTGSVIYVGRDTQRKLCEVSLVVYLESNQTHQDQLFQTYLAHPKPIVWGDAFNQQESETNHQALARCFPELLALRAAKYRQLADVILPFEIARDTTSPGAEFVDSIAHALEVPVYAAG